MDKQDWSCIIEDLELQFADFPSKENQALQDDYPLLPQLENPGAYESEFEKASYAICGVLDKRQTTMRAVRRVLVSSQYYTPAKNQPWLTAITKPTGGCYDEQIQNGLPALEPTDQRIISSGNSMHSAQGRHQEVSQRLLWRAAAIEGQAQSVQACIHAAVLANLAGKLLGNLTTHLSLEATRLQHAAEVRAECLFIGVRQRMVARKRVADIEQQVDRIVATKGFGPDTPGRERKREQQRASALTRIFGDLSRISQTYLHREIEAEYLASVRDGARKAFVATLVGSDWWKRTWGGIANRFWSYGIGLVSKPKVLLASVTSWIFVFGLLFRLALDPPRRCVNDDFPRAPGGYGIFEYVLQSATTFIALEQGLSGSRMPDLLSEALQKREGEPEGEPELRLETRKQVERSLRLFWAAEVLEMGVGCGHVGVLIAKLLEWLTRK